MERQVDITTPQNVTFRYRVAGIPQRALAWLLDTLFMTVGVIVVMLLMMALWGSFSTELAAASSILLFFVINFGYAVFFEVHWNGQTPGKRILGLRVIRDDGTAIDVRAAFVRNLLRMFDGFPQIGIFQSMLVGAVVACFNERTKRLGDLAAETIVVKVSRTRVPQGFQATRGAYNSLRENPMLVERIKRAISLDERELLIDLCVRSDEIELTRRAELFQEVASTMTELLDFELPKHMSAEKLVQNITDVLLDFESPVSVG